MIFTRIDVGDPIAVADVLELFPKSDELTGIVKSYLNIQLLSASHDYQKAADSYVNFCEHLNEVISAEHPIAILAAGDCAGALLDAGGYVQAFAVGKDAIDRGRKLAPNHNMLRLALRQTDEELLRAGRLPEARECFEEAAAIRRNTHPDTPHPSYPILHGLTWVSFGQENYAEAEKLSEKLLNQSAGNAHEVVAWANHSRARVLDRLGRNEEAVRLDKEALRVAKLVTHYQNPTWIERLAVIHYHHGEFNRAKEILVQALDIELSRRPPNHPRIADRQMTRTWVHLGETAKAQEMAKRVLASRIKELPEDDPRIREAERLARGN